MDTVINGKTIRIFPNPVDLFQAAAADFARRADIAVVDKGEFSVVLAGGNTAKFFFDILAGERKIPWEKIKFFFGDERYVPADDAESNYFSAKQYLFSKVPVLSENIYRIPTEFADPKMAAADYELTLRRVLNLKEHEFPKFDLVYLGLGENAHTASLMPFSDVVADFIMDSPQMVASLWVPSLKMYRITLTPPAINYSACICFLVTGKNKASAVSQTLTEPLNPQQYPAQLIQAENGTVIWYLDQAAASSLNVFLT